MNRKLVAGIDIGNSTTEAALAYVDGDDNKFFLTTSSVPTTGVKGSEDNLAGIMTALDMALSKAGLKGAFVDHILLNRAPPVLSANVLETIRQTVITDSVMLGHDPGTPAGMGVAVGLLCRLEELDRHGDAELIAVADGSYSYEAVAAAISKRGGNITGLILENDEAVLVYNRLHKKICVIDEVNRIDLIPSGVLAAIEVSPPAMSLQVLSNPYGIASLLGLDPEETRRVIPIAKGFLGKRSGVVIKTPGGNVSERSLNAGMLTVYGVEKELTVNIDAGAEEINSAVNSIEPIRDIRGQDDTNAGKAIKQARSLRDPTQARSLRDPKQARSLRDSDEEKTGATRITDLFAVDTYSYVPISGALSGEKNPEKAVGLATAVQSEAVPMTKISELLAEKTGSEVSIAGAEAVMAVLAALTTPGISLPLAVLDLGGGSTDGALADLDGTIRSVHLAGAGNLVDQIIQSELDLAHISAAELLKQYPVAKVENFNYIRAENGQVIFYDEPLPSKLYGKVVMITETALLPIDEDLTVERIVRTRREAKKKVFAANALRCLRQLSPDMDIPFVALVGGSALDFEIPSLIMEALLPYKMICGRANIQKYCGPRNAVATGLVMSFGERVT